MAKKPSSKVEGIQAKIEIARKAVSKMDDDSLKPVAFQTVLQQLLALDEPAVLEAGRIAAEAQPVTTPKKKPKRARPRGPKGRIEILIEEGFFKQKRTLSQVKEELVAHVWHHRVEVLSPALGRLVQERKLRRLKEPEVRGGKLVWRYSNW